MNRELCAVLLNCMNVLPARGRALDWRGAVLRRALRSCGERLRVSARVNVYDPANVTVGSHVYLGYCTYLGGGDITIEDEVVVGPFCSIVAGNHTRRDGSYRYGPYDAGTIRIGRGTWLGSHVTVAAGVTIGAGCLVGANSVVTEDVPDHTFVAGVPASKIRSLGG